MEKMIQESEKEGFWTLQSSNLNVGAIMEYSLAEDRSGGLLKA
ncbi:hypothetical protein [Peribacillus simplex]